MPRLIWTIVLALTLIAPTGFSASAAEGLDKLSHILVIYLENRSFDNIFGEFPGANGVQNAGEYAIQRDANGVAYRLLLAPKGPFDVAVVANPPEVRAIKLEALPNKPFAIDGIRPGVTIATYYPRSRAQILHQPGANQRRQA